jgi:hypothetical protein
VIRAHHTVASVGTLNPTKQSVKETLYERAQSKEKELICQHTFAKTRQRHAMHGQSFVIVIAVLAHGEAHKHKFAHIAQHMERQTERLLPYRIEPVILHRARAVRYLEPGRTRRRRRIEAPVRKVHRDFDVWVQGWLVHDLVTVCVFWERELLCRDHLDGLTHIDQGSGENTDD